MSNANEGTDVRTPTQRVRKQAVVVIHGIGEQRPMATLRAFASTVLGRGHYCKPDRMSDSHELVRLRAMEPLDVGDRWLMTDFYELYWAHEVLDTQLVSILEWLWALFRRPVEGYVHVGRIQRFKMAAVAAVMLALAGALGVWRYWEPLRENPIVGGLVVLAGVLGVRAVLRYLLRPVVDVAGDAARYLSARPRNVQARQAIREAGFALLERLHDDPQVDRIVVVGHSLGSVIGYDVLTSYWGHVHAQVPVRARTLHTSTKLGAKLAAAELALRQAGPEDRAAARAKRDRARARFDEMQRRAFEDGRGYGRKERRILDGAQPHRPWLVSDFVTLGSPLAYGDFLRADSADDFEQTIALLETQTCPPEPYWDWDPTSGSYKESSPRPGDARRPWGSYGFRKAPGDGRYYWHQAALFGLTRWTNLYYPRDVVGERVDRVFGPGVRDVRLEPAAHERGRWPMRWWPHWAYRPGSHVRYWRSRKGAPLEASSRWLREIVFRRAGAEPPPIDDQPVRSVNRRSARYDELPAHLRHGERGGDPR